MGFDTILKKYNGVKSRHGLYDFDSIMRAAAKAKDFDSFKKGLPTSFARTRNAQDLFKNVRKGMMLAASLEESTGALRFKPFITASTKEELNKMTLRDKYITE